MRKYKASELVLDYTLYPRNNVDANNVRTLHDAVVAGIELPPVIICKKTKRVVDGFHRVKERLSYGDENATIECIEKTYKTDADLFADAMRYNAAHGARLDPCDRTHCIIIGERLGLTIDQIAGALHMPADKLGSLKADRTATAGGLSVALKRTVRDFAGKQLTPRQVEANEKLSGMNQVFYANQLIQLIESKMLDTDDAKLMERLRVLNGYLDELLKAA